MESLANKYRPKVFEDVVGQNIVVKILKRQAETKELNNVYIFSGVSGCGKTTLARIFANEINDHIGIPIEIDAASNNGVDNIRDIITEANQRTIDGSTYKIVILDECHMITTQGWNAFLKCLEEPPKYTIFMFCTTNLEKVPETIKNRAMTLVLNRIATDLIYERLEEVCKKEQISNYNDTIDYISKISDGSMRTALSYLDKCVAYMPQSHQLSLQDTLQLFNVMGYEDCFVLTEAILDKQPSMVIKTLNNYYEQGFDWNAVIDFYLNFILDLTKYSIFKDPKLISIPQHYLDRVKDVTGVEDGDYSSFFIEFTNKILEIKSAIRYDSNAKNTIAAMLLNLCK